jgi:hypothetical protein
MNEQGLGGAATSEALFFLGPEMDWSLMLSLIGSAVAFAALLFFQSL